MKNKSQTLINLYKTSLLHNIKKLIYLVFKVRANCDEVDGDKMHWNYNWAIWCRRGMNDRRKQSIYVETLSPKKREHFNDQEIDRQKDISIHYTLHRSTTTTTTTTNSTRKVF